MRSSILLSLKHRKQLEESSITLSLKHRKKIEEDAIALLEILKDPSCVLMGDGYEMLREKITPLLYSTLAEQTIKKYNELFVNFSNSHHVTLLHLLILFAPSLAPLVIEDKNFVKINFRATSAKNKSGGVSALDMAISRWFAGECEYQLIELLLKYRAIVPMSQDPCFPGQTSPIEICFFTLLKDDAKRTKEEAVNLLALLGCYGYKLEQFASSWLSDSKNTDKIEAMYHLTVFGQRIIISGLKKMATDKFISVMKEAPEYLVPPTIERLATSASPRRYSQMRGSVLYVNQAQSQSSLATVAFGDDNRLTDEDEGIAALFGSSM